MAEDRAQEKTEQATPHRRQDARRKGQVAKSQEVNSVLILGAGFLLLTVFFPYMVDSTRELLTVFLRVAGDGADAESRFGAMFHAGLFGMARILAPIIIGTVVVAIAASVSQVGFLVAPSVLEPKLEKINPLEGFKRIFGKRALFELGKGLTKLGVVGLIAWSTYRGRLGELTAFMYAMPAQTQPGAMHVAALFLIRALVAMGILAALDFAWQKWEHEKQIRMSLQDIKEELKENEGDPLLKSRVRSIQQKLASQRMMESVKDAALVITNPTHYAVALGYDEGDDPAPRVLAKGKNEIAARIRKLAREHDVPIVEKPALARMLFRECDIGQVIPATLFEAVARVLAYVYSIRAKGAKGSR